MSTNEIIGRTITDILVRSKIEVGGLDEAEVCIQLDNAEIIGIPWDFESQELERQPQKDSISLFSDLSDIPECYINPERKTIQGILDAKEKRASSFWGRFKKMLRFSEGIPREYRVYKIEYRENKIKYLKNQKIVDFLMLENHDSVGFIELENGYIITEIMMAPHGTGMAGLNYCENLKSFENRYGEDYKRLKNYG
jgi:hypothetical protein